MTTVPASARTVAFGHAMRAQWALEPETLYLNHGTVGAPPKRVLAAQQAIRDAIERQPSRYLLRELAVVGMGTVPPREPRLREAARVVAEFVHARPEDLVFVDNATAGANTVLRSLRFSPGDEILVTQMGYGAVTLAADFMARAAGATVKTVMLPFPASGPGPLVEVIAAAIGPRTRLAIVDHVCSESSLVLPVAEIAKACRARGVALLVDGAHAPGQMALDIPSLGADWYTGNLHKWGWAPRSSAILWAPPERQKELHPLVISWGLGQGFSQEFDWVGTRDPSPWLAAPEAIAMMRELGLDAVWDWNHRLAVEAGAMLAKAWGTRVGGPPAMTGAMISIALPERFGATAEEALALRNALLYQDGIEVAVHPAAGGLWLRISAQIYNQPSDFERLAEAVQAR